MSNPNPPRSNATQPQRPPVERPKTAAQRASDANKLMQHAVRTNTARPDDRRPGDPQLQADHKTGLPDTKR
jgi:hypothetical protein